MDEEVRVMAFYVVYAALPTDMNIASEIHPSSLSYLFIMSTKSQNVYIINK